MKRMILVSLATVTVVGGVVAVNADAQTPTTIGAQYVNMRTVTQQRVGNRWVTVNVGVSFRVNVATQQPQPSSTFTQPPVTPSPTMPVTTRPVPVTTFPPPTIPPTIPAAGYPDATNTGVPAGLLLRLANDLTIDVPGTVIDGADISGTVSINASNVTIRRSRIRGTGFALIWIKAGLTGVRVEDSTLDGQGSSDGSMGIWGPATSLRNNITGVENGVAPDSGSVVQDNFIHNLQATGSPHYDGIQIDGGQSDIVIRHNTVLNQYDQTAAIMIDNWFGPINNISVDNNLLGGGGYTVYSDGQFSGGAISGVSFTNNRFRRGYWGYSSFVRNNPTQSGNIDDVTGRPVNL